ncbi:MAG: membrane protein insertase YidC, partial [Burkholderiales bacterium]
MDSQRLILFFVFSFSVFMLLDGWQREQQPARPATADAGQGEKAAPPSAQPPVPSEKLTATQGAVPQQGRSVPETGVTIRVETDLLIAHLGSQGGDVRRLQFKNHRDTLERSKDFVLFETGAERTYIAQAGLIGGGLPSHRTPYTAAIDNFQLADGQEQLEVRLAAPGTDGTQVTKVYRFRRGSYLIDVGFEIVNAGAAAIQPYAYYQLVRDDKPPAGDSAMVPTFTGVALYTDKEKFQKLAFSDIEKSKTQFSRNSEDGWIAILQHYFLSAWLPRAGVPREFYARRLEDGLYVAGVIIPAGAIAPGASASVTVPLYAGPEEQEKLEKIAPGLELTIDYGWLTVIAVPLFWVLAWLNQWAGNWGVAIILL